MNEALEKAIMLLAQQGEILAAQSLSIELCIKTITALQERVTNLENRLAGDAN